MKKRLQKGFGLVELIIYCGILAVVIPLVYYFVWDVVLAGTQGSAINEVSYSANFAMERILSSVRNAASASVSDNVLTLDGGEYRLNNGRIEYSGVALTSPQVEITKLQFTDLSFATSSPVIRVEISARYRDSSYYRSSISLESTAVSRK